MPQRKLRSDSVTAAVKAAINVSLPELRPPPHITLSEDAEKFWTGVIHARARDEWRTVDLVVAAQLAECQALIEQESTTLRAEGMVVPNERGTLVENARNRVVQNLAQREMALMRALQMSGFKAAVDPRGRIGGRQAEAKARAAAEDIEDEELLA